MADIRIIKQEAVPKCGSFEVRFSDGRPSQYFYWKDLPGRRLRRDLLTSRQGRLLELSAIGDGQQGLAPAGEPWAARVTLVRRTRATRQPRPARSINLCQQFS